jgi:hypothetical protein
VLGSHVSSDEKQVPICEIDPWRTQYFERVACPADVLIPTEDSDAWLWNPRHRWIYDKLAIALSQNLAAAPHGVAPPSYPVFSKPIYNLKGMGAVGGRTASRICHDLPARSVGRRAGGDHVSSDLAVVDGVPHWWRHARPRQWRRHPTIGRSKPSPIRQSKDCDARAANIFGRHRKWSI